MRLTLLTRSTSNRIPLGDHGDHADSVNPVNYIYFWGRFCNIAKVTMSSYAWQAVESTRKAVHPNEERHRIFADALIEQMEKLKR